MSETRTAFVTFFPIRPNNMGSSTVVNSRFINWPGKKRLFQISHIKKINNKKIQTIFIKKENPLYKIFSLPEMTFRVLKYLKRAKKKQSLKKEVPGADWSKACILEWRAINTLR